MITAEEIKVLCEAQAILQDAKLRSDTGRVDTGYDTGIQQSIKALGRTIDAACLQLVPNPDQPA